MIVYLEHIKIKVYVPSVLASRLYRGVNTPNFHGLTGLVGKVLGWNLDERGFESPPGHS